MDHIRNGQPANKHGEEVRTARCCRFDQAFSQQFDLDLFATMYGIEIGGKLLDRDVYRLSKASPMFLAEAGWIGSEDQVVAWGLILDADNKDLLGCDPRAGKVPWTDEIRDQFETQWWPSATSQVPWLAEPTVFYTTTNGIRLVYAFDRLVPVRGKGGLGDLLSGAILECWMAGFQVDRACQDWVRLMRLPCCLRESKDPVTGIVTHKRTVDSEFFALSWGRVDLRAQELAPADKFRVHSPESFRCLSGISPSELVSRPNSRELLAMFTGVGVPPPDSVRPIYLQTGEVPTDDEAAGMIRGVKANSLSQAVSIIKQQIKKASEGAEGPRASCALGVYSVLFENKRIDIGPDGVSNLHGNTYGTVSDFVWLVQERLGVDANKVSPRLIYSLFLPAARGANEAREESDSGRRTDEELKGELWRIVESTFANRLGKLQFDKEEEEEEQRRVQDILKSLDDPQSDIKRHIIAEALAGMLGENTSVDEVKNQVDQMMLFNTSLGVSVVKIVQGAPGEVPKVRLSDPLKNFNEWVCEVRDSGHSLVKYTTTDSKTAEIKTDNQIDVLRRHGAAVGKRVRGSRLIAANSIEYVYDSGKRDIRFVVKYPGVAEDVKAVYHPEIQQYIELCGGKHKGKLLDWLACFPIITDPLPALYFYGPPGLGKGMFLEGLIQLTSSKKAALFTDALGAFQDHFADTFLVSIDEDSSTANGAFQKDVLGVLRRMIGGHWKTLNLKGEKGIDVDGENRLLITANNQDVLAITRDCSPEDLEAINGRVFFLDTTSQAKEIREFLHRSGGRHGNDLGPGTVKMNYPRRIAEHVMWLHQNREVRRGERFLIDAPRTVWHEQLRISSSGGTLTCFAIEEAWRMMEEGKTVPGMHVRQDRKQVFVEPRLFEGWMEASGHARKIKDTSKVLKRLSTSQDRIRLVSDKVKASQAPRPRVYILDVPAILSNLDRNGRDPDFRSLFGEEMWKEVAPKPIQDEVEGSSKAPPEKPYWPQVAQTRGERPAGVESIFAGIELVRQLTQATDIVPSKTCHRFRTGDHFLKQAASRS